MTAPARRPGRRIPVEAIDDATAGAALAAVAPILRNCPPHLRPLATGQRKPTPEEIAATDAMIARIEQAAREEARARQEAGRAKLWQRRVSHKYRAAQLSKLQPQQNPQGMHLTSGTAIPRAVASWPDSPYQGLLLKGPSRHGKSYAAYAIGNAARDRGAYATAWSMPMLAKALRGNLGAAEEAAAWEEVLNAELLIVDDLGQENVTDWVREQLHVIGEHRLTTPNRRTIITTNFGYSELDEMYGTPVVERLLEDTVVAVVEGQKLSMLAQDPF